MARTITVATLNSRLSAEPGLALIDVRTPAEYAQMHVAAARNAPLDRLDPAALADAGVVARNRPVLVICRSQTRAAMGAAAFEKAGFSDVTIVEGGTSGWAAAGYPLERRPLKVISLERQVRIAAGAMVLIGAVLAWLVNPAFILLSGAIGAGLVFAGVTDICGLALLLGRAPWNQKPGGTAEKIVSSAT